MSKFSERFRALKDESELTLKELSTALDISTFIITSFKDLKL